MSQAIIYVKTGNRKLGIKEVFLGFFPLKHKKFDEILVDEILQCREYDGPDVMCPLQGYDNAANIVCVHGGTQAIIKGKNKK